MNGDGTDEDGSGAGRAGDDERNGWAEADPTNGTTTDERNEFRSGERKRAKVEFGVAPFVAYLGVTSTFASLLGPALIESQVEVTDHSKERWLDRFSARPRSSSPPVLFHSADAKDAAERQLRKFIANSITRTNEDGVVVVDSGQAALDDYGGPSVRAWARGRGDKPVIEFRFICREARAAILTTVVAPKRHQCPARILRALSVDPMLLPGPPPLLPITDATEEFKERVRQVNSTHVHPKCLSFCPECGIQAETDNRFHIICPNGRCEYEGPAKSKVILANGSVVDLRDPGTFTTRTECSEIRDFTPGCSDEAAEINKLFSENKIGRAFWLDVQEMHEGCEIWPPM